MYVFCPKPWLYLKHSFVQIGRNSFRRSLEQGYEDLLRTQGVVSAEALKCYIQRQDNRTQTLLQIREKELEASKNKTHGTYRANTYTHQMLLAFLEEQGQSELTPKVEILGIDRYIKDNPIPGRRFTIDAKEVYARILIQKLP